MTPINKSGIVRDMIGIGASAGGIEALVPLLATLPADLRAVLAVVIHRAPLKHSRLDAVLGRGISLPVVEPAQGECPRPGRVYLAPRDHHLRLVAGHWVLDRGPRQHRVRPAIDPLFMSAAHEMGSRVVGVLMSGTGSDGVEGLLGIKAAGGLSLVQDPVEARQPAMPMRAIREDDVDAVLPAKSLGVLLAMLACGEVVSLAEVDREA